MPIIDFSFGPDYKKHPTLANILYPTYHTAYETFDLVEKIIDPDFKLLTMSSQLLIALARDFSDNIVLDFNLPGYNEIMNKFKEDPEVQKMVDLGLDISGLLNAIETFENSTELWHKELIEKWSEIENSPFMARYYNDQMMNVEKAFLLPAGRYNLNMGGC